MHGAEPGQLHLWWLGQSGFLLKSDTGTLLIDPYLSDSLTRKYSQTDKPHVRMTECPVSPNRLDFIDVVSSSHNHTDHLDHETLRPLIEASPNLRLVIPEANRAFVADRLGCKPDWPVGLWDGSTADVGGFRFTGVAAAHESLEADENGHHKCLGYIIRTGRWTIFHPGDAVPYAGMAEKVIAAAGGRRIDLAMMPINGRLPERRVTGNFWGAEAADFARAINAGLAVPMHYEMFEFNTETPDEFRTRCREIGQQHQVVRCGERLSVK